MIDIQILPKKAQNELIDFYQFLLERYKVRKIKQKGNVGNSKNRTDGFFNSYNVNLDNYTFNRDELYDR